MDGMIRACAFVDEMRKIAASKGRMRVAQSRSGRRPISVDTLLKKEKDGTLFKEATPIFDVAKQLLGGDDKPIGKSAPSKRKSGDAPTVGENATVATSSPPDPVRSAWALSGIL